MTFKEYNEGAMSTCMETSKNDVYAINGLAAEVGEIQDKIAKWTRKGLIVVRENDIHYTELGTKSSDFCPSQELAKEVGDVLWFCNLLANRLGYSLEAIAKMNLEKLASRQQRGVIDGNGDNR